MLITAIRLGGLVVKTFVYQPMDLGSNPGKGNFFFFQKNAKIYRRIYASLACKGLSYLKGLYPNPGIKYRRQDSCHPSNFMRMNDQVGLSSVRYTPTDSNVHTHRQYGTHPQTVRYTPTDSKVHTHRQ